MGKAFSVFQLGPLGSVKQTVSDALSLHGQCAGSLRGGSHYSLVVTPEMKIWLFCACNSHYDDGCITCDLAFMRMCEFLSICQGLCVI